MDRVNRILADQAYCSALREIEAAEKGREFCGHTFDHLVETARLTYLLLLEQGERHISREMAYATGLLHDIGRASALRQERDHALVSAEMAEPILRRSAFNCSEQTLILRAITQHRHKGGEKEVLQHRSPLSDALSRADSLARLCYRCNSAAACYRFQLQPGRKGLIY